MEIISKEALKISLKFSDNISKVEKDKELQEYINKLSFQIKNKKNDIFNVLLFKYYLLKKNNFKSHYIILKKLILMNNLKILL